MDVLIRYGFSIEEIKNMMDMNPEIEATEDKSIYKLIDILGAVGCLNNHIKNICTTNPFYLSSSIKNVESIIDKYKKIGLDNLYTIFDSNPYLLNMDQDIIDNLIKGLKKEEIQQLFYYEAYKII